MKTNKSYITNILLAIIPAILVAGYFERYLSFIPQYFLTTQTYAYEQGSETSTNSMVTFPEFEQLPTSLIDTIASLEVDEWKVKRVYSYLAGRGAPLAKSARYLVQAATYYKIDYRLVAAISIIESSGGKNTYRPYNGWGWGGADNAYTFKNWEEAITTVSRGLSRYYANGANTPTKIAPAYNPHTPNDWARKVTYVMTLM